jgi:exonuclease III
MSIIQWNCRGFKPNFEELKLIISESNAQIICLQETFLKDSDTIGFKGFNMYNINRSSIYNNRPIGGVCLMIKKGIPHAQIKIKSNLQIVAAEVSLLRRMTIASIYIPPHYNLYLEEINTIISQLPYPFILCGDFNSHSELWGCFKSNKSGLIMQNVLETNDLCLLNNGTATYLHPATGHYSAIDLTVCSPELPYIIGYKSTLDISRVPKITLF